MALISCPICAKRFDPEQTPSRPFCGERCRQIDLGRWLSEKYSLPELSTDADEEDGDPPAKGAGNADSGDES